MSKRKTSDRFLTLKVAVSRRLRARLFEPLSDDDEAVPLLDATDGEGEALARTCFFVDDDLKLHKVFIATTMRLPSMEQASPELLRVRIANYEAGLREARAAIKARALLDRASRKQTRRRKS